MSEARHQSARFGDDISVDFARWILKVARQCSSNGDQ
jgi:hypothetical protein